MRKEATWKRIRPWTLLVLALVLTAGCATRTAVAPGPAPGAPQPAAATLAQATTAGSGACLRRPDFPGSLTEQYNASIFDAAVFRPCRQFDGLEPVTGRAVMGTFISCWKCGGSGGSCSSKCLDPGFQKMPSDVWVSHGEQVLKHCSQFSDVVLGMQQLQGLPPQENQPPDSWNILVVEVPGPQVLFRPCANPDPTTPGPCGEDFPETYPCYDPNGCADNLLAARLEAHRSWIAGQSFSAWQIPDQWFGYPWTRQGYTYNWSATAESLGGTSEYVIPGGMKIKVCKRLTAAEFCQSSLSEIEAFCDEEEAK